LLALPGQMAFLILKKDLNELFHIFADYIPQIFNIFVECNPQIILFNNQANVEINGVRNHY
jgi:hypothetical protein